MANNVYVGERYVPKFDEDTTWQNNKTYKPLTIVKYGNNWFTSKRNVPINQAPTGADNDPYWAMTGDYNGAIANLQTQINELNSDYKKRNFLLFGDSLYEGYTPGSGTQHGWGYWVKKHLEDKGYHAYLSSDVAGVGNTGFATVKTYVDHLNTTISDHPEYLDINMTDVVVYTGSNDRSAVANTPAGIAAFVGAVKAYWPNANIKIGYFSAHHDVSGENIVQIFKNVGKYGASYIVNSAALLCDASYLVDGTHLSQAGYEFYSSYLADGAIDGTMSYEFIFEDIPITTVNGTITAIGMNFRVKDGMIYQWISNIGSNPGTFDVTTSGSDLGELGGISYDYPLTLRVRMGIVATCAMYDPDDNNFRGIVDWMQNSINSGAIRLYLYGDAGDIRMKIYGNRMVNWFTP